MYLFLIYSHITHILTRSVCNGSQKLYSICFFIFLKLYNLNIFPFYSVHIYTKKVSIWVSRNPRIESRQSIIFAPAVVAGWKHELLAQARWHLKEIRAYGPVGMYLFAKQRMCVTNVLFLRTLYVCTSI